MEVSRNRIVKKLPVSNVLQVREKRRQDMKGIGYSEEYILTVRVTMKVQKMKKGKVSKCVKEKIRKIKET